jgi:transcriptional regulator with XRE-family HTH domain
MNTIRALRRVRGLTQSRLAAAAGTSQPTVAAYEAGRKSPTLRTLRRLAESVGLEIRIDFHPAMTREERRSLAIHRAIANVLRANPLRVLALAHENLERMRSRAHESSGLLREWGVLLERPLEALLPVLTDPSPWARELRHVTPFAGLLGARERAAVIRGFVDVERSRG